MTTIRSDMRVNTNLGSTNDDVFAVFCEDESLDFEAGVHVMTPTSASTNAYVRKAKNVNISGGIYAAGNPQDIIRLLNELPQWARESALRTSSADKKRSSGYPFTNEGSAPPESTIPRVFSKASNRYPFINEGSAPPESTIPRIFSNASGRYPFDNELCSAPSESTIPRALPNVSGRVFTGRSRT